MRYLVLSLLYLLSITTYAHATTEAIMDVGSSGTRLYIYKNDELQWSKRVQPGLAQLAIEDIPKYMQELLAEQHEHDVELYVYGTAGMRLLTEDQQTIRYQKLQEYVQAHTDWRVLDIRSITGQEEGVFAWVAANEKHSETYPIIEIGGASMQLTFELPAEYPDAVRPEDTYAIHWQGHEILLWSKTYLRYGLNEVEQLFLNEGSCYSHHYPLPNQTLAYGDIASCIQAIENNSHLALHQQFKDIKNILAQHTVSNYLVLGAIRYNVASAPLNMPQSFSMRELKQKTDEVHCQQSWLDLLPASLQDPYLYRLCLATSYYYASMVDGIGISEDIAIRYPDASQNIDWTKGALLLKHQQG